MRTSRQTLFLAVLTGALLVLTGCLSVPEENREQGAAAPPPSDVVCPTDAPRAPSEEIPQGVVDGLVSLTEDAATTCAEQLGWVLRIVRRDDSEFQVTMDYRPDRVNVTVDAGTVTSARVG